MSDKDYVSKKIIDGVEIIEYKDGHTTFNPIEPTKKETKKEEKVDNRKWYQKLYDWWHGSGIKPYVKVRDLADPFGDRCDCDAGSDGKNGVEVGIKVNF